MYKFTLSERNAKKGNYMHVQPSAHNLRILAEMEQEYENHQKDLFKFFAKSTPKNEPLVKSTLSSERPMRPKNSFPLLLNKSRSPFLRRLPLTTEASGSAC